MMSASPTAASPAASVITKMVKTWPCRSASRCEKATRLMLTALSISSMHISTVIMLRRAITPTRPIAKSVAESIKYCAVLGTSEQLLHFLLRLHPLDHVAGRGLFFVRRQLPLADHDRPDHGHEQKERGHFEGHEVVSVQRHPHRFGVAVLAGARASHELVRIGGMLGQILFFDGRQFPGSVRRRPGDLSPLLHRRPHR